MASMDKLTPRGDGKVTEKSSPVTKYEAILLEMAGPGLSEERVSCIFQIMDQLQPHMGVFSQIMKRIRDELFEAIYSDQYTGTSAAKKEGGSYIQRLPYFTLIKRVYDERDDKSEQLTEQLNVVKKRLFEKQKEYEGSLETIAGLYGTGEELQTTINSLESQLAERNMNISGLEEELAEEREKMDTMEYNLQCDISELREELEEVQHEASFLRQYKTGYDELEASFVGRGHMFEDVMPRKKKKSVVATKRAHFISGIESTLKLEEQILSVQNLMVEEFDKFMEEHKSELKEKSLDDSMEIDQYDTQQADLERADQQLLIMQGRFQRSMDEMRTELELLAQHKAMLQEQLHTLTQSRPQARYTRSSYSKKGRRHRDNLNILGESRPETRESGMSTGLEEEPEEDPNVDPFVPQERIFSKYAAMMYTSDNNGKSFHEFKDARYCASCGEKSVICPHKILSQEHVFPLPPGSTHLKIARPKVRINQQMIDNMFQPVLSDIAMDTMSLMSMPKHQLHSRLSIVAGMSPMVAVSGSHGAKSPAGESSSEQPLSLPDTPGFTAADSHLVNTIQRLWEDFKTRTHLERAVPRSLTQARVVSLVEQFAAYILWMDDFGEDDETQSILDNLYSFMLDRYLRTDVMFLAMHDFISSIIEHSSTNKMVQLFMHVLLGNYDGAVFRYLLLMCDFIDQVEWQRVEDFRAFAAAVYPFLNDDDLETLHMGYTSFSENKVSKNLVMEYVIYIILKYREPRFLEMETKLMNHCGKDANFMTEVEYAESADAVLAVSNDRLRRRLFFESQIYVMVKDGMDEGVPVLRLAQLTSYLELLQIAPVVKETVVELVCEARERPSSAKTVSTRPEFHAPQEHLPTMTGAKNLALNIDRRTKCRQQRMRSNMMA